MLQNPFLPAATYQIPESESLFASARRRRRRRARARKSCKYGVKANGRCRKRPRRGRR